MIKARASAGLTQEQLAQRMNTTQAVIARLESGRVKPSTRTLERLAHATGMKLRISFEPAPQSRVARSSPLVPCCATVAATSTMNAPAGPPIWKRQPPSSETTKPSMIAV